MSAVHISEVAKSYGPSVALDTVSLEFRQGAVTAIIGRSGSGKSTLLKTINGMVRPDAGRVEVGGRPVDYENLPALRRGIGYAVQGTGLFPHLRVKQNISLLARLEGWTEAAIGERLEQLMAMVQLAPELADRYPHSLSGGQQQRVGLARAMMLNPPLLLLDEAFGALDPLTRLDIHERLLELQRLEPRTAILVTHDMREALELADEIVVLEAGRLVLRDTPAALKQRYPGLEPERLLLRVLEQAA